ncbi:hypothetical protein NKH77_40245 [Streptomyces sp. M19]
MYGLVEAAVHAVHARGMVISDLHMSNVMVSDDQSRVVLLDFEAASPRTRKTGRSWPTRLRRPSDRRGTGIDRYALACLRLALHLPLTTHLAVDRRKAVRLAQDITRLYPVTWEELRPPSRRSCADAARGAGPADGLDGSGDLDEAWGPGGLWDLGDPGTGRAAATPWSAPSPPP